MEKKSIVEEALLSMKNLEEAVSENAKGILASTMKEEIKDLVKESLQEQSDEDEDEVEDIEVSNDDTEVDFGSEESDDESEDEMEMDVDTMSMDMDMEDDDEMDMDSEEDEMEPIDLTNASDEEILKVFKAMGDEDGIIVKKDDNRLHLEDENADVEYLIDLGESEEEKMNEEDDDELYSDAINKIFEKDVNSMDEDMNLEGDYNETEEGMSYEGEQDEVVYEISLDDDVDMAPEGEYLEMNDLEETMEMTQDEPSEDYDYTESYKMETKEGKMSVKPKGVGMGKPKFTYKKSQGGFDENKKHANPTKGTGKPKFEFKEGEMADIKKSDKKAETKEAARTLGNGKYFRKGGLPKPRSHSKFNANIEESVNQYEEQLRVLREKNEEYRKALNIFREKLNEVAVFNSNLAYATRLFTEHTTTKSEKINIMRRFDNVETIKESKNLYQTIKEELGSVEKPMVKESIVENIDRTPSKGSTNLVESKTYENPQFLRMKDLMSKMNK